MKLKFIASYLLQSAKYVRTVSSNNKPDVINTDNSLDFILAHTDYSIGRIGDGEFRWAAGIPNGIGFQQNDDKLQAELRRIMLNPPEKFKLALPAFFTFPWLEYTPGNLFSWMYFWNTNKDKLLPLTIKNYQYLDANLSRLYQDRINKSVSESRYSKLKKVWHSKRILTVEGENTLLGVNNDLFADAVSVSRIIIPAKNAYSMVDDIEEAIRRHFLNFDLVIISAGPTATVLAARLAGSSTRVLDLGHFDLEYEWMRAKTSGKSRISGRANNELDMEAVINGLNVENDVMSIWQFKESGEVDIIESVGLYEGAKN